MGFTTSTDVSALIQAANYGAVRTQLALVIGTTVQAFDADLTTWAGITPGANVGTALAIAIGSAGAVVTNNAANTFSQANTFNGQSNFNDTLAISDGSSILWGASAIVLGGSGAVLTLSVGDLRITTAGTNSASVVTVGGTQTLTNKTLDAPTITNTATAATINATTVAVSALNPASNDGAPLGTTALNWSDIFLATGSVYNVNNGNWVMTHTSGIQTIGTGTLKITTPTTDATSVVTQSTVPHSISFSVDGGSTALATGTQIPVKTPYGGTLVGYTMTASPSGSITFNIFRSADAAGLPTISIVNNAGGGGGSGTLPAISAGVEGKSTTFTNWGSTTITANDNLALNLTTVDSVVTKATLVLYYR